MQSLTQEEMKAYESDGYYVARGLFSPEETQVFIDHYMAMNASGKTKNQDGEFPANDPLLAFPRILQPHRWDETSLRYMIDDRLRRIMTDLLGREPLAVQTMVYFKPPGARGQALHQDQRYLLVEPGTCMAAWLALDRCDTENGCLQVVPGTQNIPVLCPELADITKSFVAEQVPTPAGAEVVDVIMEPGDVLFFNGSLIHGSGPNSSETRFRRSLIAHYIDGAAEKVGQYYYPIQRFDGSVVEGVEPNSQGSSCGVFVDVEGHEQIEIVSRGFAVAAERH